MSDMVWCQRLKKEAKRLESSPFPGALGEYIFNHISEETFNEWVEVQTKLINENRLDLTSLESQEFLFGEMIKFLELE